MGGDVNLGSVKAKLEVDAANWERDLQQAIEALKKVGASAEQTSKFIAEFMKVPAENRAAFITPLLEAANAAENLGKKIKETKGFFDGFADSFKKGLGFGSAFEIGRQAADLFLGGLKAIGAEFVEIVKKGAEVEKITSSFQQLTASIGQSSEAMLRAGQEGTKGLVTNFDLMSAANKAILLGLPVTAKEMGTLSAAATALGRAMGQDAKKSLDDLIIGLGRGSPKILDNLGIMVKAKDAYEAYAEANHKTVEAMSQAEKTTAVYTAAIKAAEERTTALGEVSLNAADRVQQIRVAWANWTEELGKSINTNAEVLVGLKLIVETISGRPGTTLIDEINAGLSVLVERVVAAVGGIKALVDVMRSGNLTRSPLVAMLEGANKALAEFQARVGEQRLGQTVAATQHEMLDRLTQKGYRPSQAGGERAGGGPDKDLQNEMDRLSGKKAQEEVDRIRAAVKRLGLEGVADVDALGKRLIDLGGKGAKVPEQLMGTWTDAFIKEGSKLGKQPESLTKQVDAAYKANSKNIRDALKRDEEAWAQYNKTRVFIDRQTEEILRAQLHDGTLSVKQEYDLRRAEIVASTETQIDQIRRMADATKDPAQRAALEALIKEWERIRDKEIEATVAAQRYAQVSKTFGDLGNILGGVADLFDAIGISADSAVGKIVGGLQTAISSVQNFAAQTTTAGKIGAGLSAAAGVFRTGQEKGALAGAASGALTGAGIGFMVGGPAGAAVGAVAGIVTGIVGSLRKPEYKKIMNDIGKSWGVQISEGLAKEIEQIAKTNKLSRTMAELLDVSKIIGESGKDPREFTGKINDLMNAIKLGSVPAAQGLAELGRAFNQVADAALKSGNIGDKALVGLIKRARELGEVTPEMKEFISGQLNSAVEGVKKLVEVMPADTVAKAGSSGALLAATFNAIAAEQGIVAASAALGPAYDDLMQQITKAGLEIPVALQSIGRQMELGKSPEFQAASQAAAATSQVLTGLGNAGYMDTSVLTGSADVAKQTFDQAKAAGATDKEAYQSIGGLLSDIKNASIQSGLELSGVAQELISGAQAEGVVIQGDQLTVLTEIRDILSGGGYTPSGGAGGGGGGGGTTEYGGGGYGGGAYGGGGESTTYEPGPHRWEGYAEGSGGIQDFGAGTPVTLHGREAVMTEKQMAGMGGGVSFHPTFTVDPLLSNEARADLSQYQIEEFIRQVRNNPLFQQILRDQGLRT